MSLRTESADDNFCRNLEVDHDGRVVVSSFLQACIWRHNYDMNEFA